MLHIITELFTNQHSLPYEPEVNLTSLTLTLPKLIWTSPLICCHADGRIESSSNVMFCSVSFFVYLNTVSVESDKIG